MPVAPRNPPEVKPPKQQPALRQLASIRPHPRNWRTHPPEQRKALESLIRDGGVVRPLVVNGRTGYLVDGHLRREVLIDLHGPAYRVPVLIGDWSEEQELELLAGIDGVAQMAEADPEALDGLLAELREAGAGDDLGDLLASLEHVADTALTVAGMLHEVVVDCADEGEQERAYGAMQGLGLRDIRTISLDA